MKGGQYEEVQLDTIGGGAAMELFARELERVLENMADVNTDPKAKREITLHFKFATDGNREEAGCTITASSKLAGFVGKRMTVFYGRLHGRMTAVSTDPKQMRLDWEEQSKPRRIDEVRAAQDAGVGAGDNDKN